MTETVVPVCAPHLLEKHQIKTVKDILVAPLLHLEDRPDAWEQWAALREVKSGKLTGMLLDQFTTMTQAAIHGLGFALLPEFLIQQELQERRLVVAIEGKTRSIGKYYLVWPKAKSQYAPVVAFREWLEGQI